jgi:hypothetical protein
MLSEIFRILLKKSWLHDLDEGRAGVDRDGCKGPKERKGT